MLCRINELKRAQSGFLLIQMVVYLALITFLSCIVMQWAASVSVQRMNISKKTHLILMFTAACDVLLRDLRMITATKNSWWGDEQSYIWSSHSGDIGWRLKKQKLIRTEGRYAQNGHEWIERRQSVMADAVGSFIIETHRNQNLLSITLESAAHDEHAAPLVRINRCVTVCNGVCA